MKKLLSTLSTICVRTSLLACALFVNPISLYADSAELNPSLGEVQYDFHGTHFVASYKGCSDKALKDIDALRYAMLNAADDSNARVLTYSDFKFPGNGYTMVILLSESHASIHTYPEYNACFVDLFTCGTKCSWENFDKSLRAYLEPSEVDSSIITRN